MTTAERIEELLACLALAIFIALTAAIFVALF